MSKRSDFPRRKNDQYLTFDPADGCARRLIKEACRLIASVERPCIVGTLVEYKEKDGIEAKLKFPSRGDVVVQLHEACSREVLVVCTGAEEFLGEGSPPDIDPDQPEIALGAEYDAAA